MMKSYRFLSGVPFPAKLFFVLFGKKNILEKKRTDPLLLHTYNMFFILHIYLLSSASVLL